MTAEQPPPADSPVWAWNRPETRRIREMIEVISEREYSATWLHEIEYDVWLDTQRDDRAFATAEEAVELRRIAEEHDCWVAWDDDLGGIVALTLAEWGDRAAAIAARGGGRS